MSYSLLNNLSAGLAGASSILVDDNIYIIGGLTSGHNTGFVNIDVQQFSPYIEAIGRESGAITITLTDDAGNLITGDVRVIITGRIVIPEVDSLLVSYYAKQAANRALGGQTSISSDKVSQAVSLAQNNVTDPTSDEFQLNASKTLQEQTLLFPVLYSTTDTKIHDGYGIVLLEPRSEDPLTNIDKILVYIKDQLTKTTTDTSTTEQLAALGDLFNTIKLSPTIIQDGLKRDLYSIETKVTIVDDFYYGQSISGIDLDIQASTNQEIYNILSGSTSTTTGYSGTEGSEGQTKYIEDVNPNSDSSLAQSGQSLTAVSLLPMQAAPSQQYPTIETKYYGQVAWIPTIKERQVTNDSTLQEVIDEVDLIDHEIPFGSSQLFDAMFSAAGVMSEDSVENIDKLIYIVSDNSENLSQNSRDAAIEEVNSIDGEKQVPVIYTVVSTSTPLTIASQIERTKGDAAKITEDTNGRSLVLMSNNFTNQIVNSALSASGGLGHGIYRRRYEFNKETAITGMDILFTLPVNTNGTLKYRTSVDKYSFTSYSSTISGSHNLTLSDVSAKIIDFEVEISTGFIDSADDPNITPTGTPKLVSITLHTSVERDDYIYLNKETVLTNAQQVAAAVEATLPESSLIEIGVSTSESNDWRDYSTDSRPAIKDGGKTLLLKRNRESTSIVPNEVLTTFDNILYFAPEGAWDPYSDVHIYSTLNGVETEIYSGFALFPREGQVYFNTRQNPNKSFRITVVNSETMQVGVRVRNRLHDQSVSIEGVGYIYSTNDNKPIPLSKMPPTVFNLRITPDSPVTTDTFTAVYTFMDVNGNPESGSIVNWYKNGVQLYELQNKLTWTNSNLLLSNKLKVNDMIYFAVIPSDGAFTGSLTSCPPVIIKATPATASNVKIVAVKNGVISNSNYDTSSTLRVIYEFSSENNEVEDGTIIKWYVNGILFKENIYSTITSDPYVLPKDIVPGEVSNGILVQAIGNQVQVEVTPKTKQTIGSTIQSEIVTLVNTVPVVSDIRITPNPGNTQSYLAISYTITDFDITSGVQTDQSLVTWFKNGVEALEYRNLKQIPPSALQSGNKWQARISPYDGLEYGSNVNSNLILII